MDFVFNNNFRVSVPPTLTLTIGIVFLFTLLIRVVPMISVSRHTIISYKQDRGRSLQRPLWQRTGIDLLLLTVIAYFYYQVVQQEGLIVVEGVADIERAYDQPLVFLLPPLSILAFSLLALRFLPFILSFLTWLIHLTNSVGLLIVTRQLERSPQLYQLPLILLISTVSLGIYTASFARTIDHYLIEQQYYRIGADIAVRIYSANELFAGTNSENEEAYANVSMHISEFHEIQSIDYATRIGEYGAVADLTSGNVNGKFYWY